MQAKLASEHLAADTTLAFIGSTAIAFISFGAIINSRLIRFWGTRNAALLACSLLGGSQILSSWATKNVAALFITNGAVLGMGVSICFMVRYHWAPYIEVYLIIDRRAVRFQDSTSSAGAAWQTDASWRVVVLVALC